MYKKIIFILSFSVIFIFGFSQNVFANDKALGLDDNVYFISYVSPRSGINVRMTYNVPSDSLGQIFNVNEYHLKENEWVLYKVYPEGVAFSGTTVQQVGTNDKTLLDFLNSNELIIDGSGDFVDPPSIPTLQDLMKDLLTGLLTDLKILLPICLVIFSMVLSTSLIKRMIFSFL